MDYHYLKNMFFFSWESGSWGKDIEGYLYIKRFSIENIRGFNKKHEFIFIDENESFKQWTVVLGNNGVGKTTLLRCIASFELKEKEEDSTTVFSIMDKPSLSELILGGQKSIEAPSCAIVFTNGTNLTFEYANNASPYALQSLESISPSFNIYGYGVTRSINKNGLSEDKEKLNSENLFFPESKLADFEEWLLELRLAKASEEEKIAKMAEKRLNLIKKVILSEVFPEISDFKFKTNEKLKSSVVFISESKDLHLSDLGYGYQSSLAWILDFCKKMIERYPNSENPLAEGAVLLVDEIDLHLHPKWQRNLIKNLSKLFPKTQFIVTTHSPLIIQSIENINLYILRKNEEGIKAERVNYKNFVGWDLEEILAELLEMEDDTHSEEYQNLIEGFGKALDENDYPSANEYYQKLLAILHPTNPQRKLLKIQLSQLVEI